MFEEFLQCICIKSDLLQTFQEAPVVARAALFLECARFVHRCNRGNWPEWMKGHHVNITKKGLSRGRSPIVGNKRNQKLQWNAAKLFYQWGDVSISFSSTYIKKYTKR